MNASNQILNASIVHFCVALGDKPNDIQGHLVFFRAPGATKLCPEEFKSPLHHLIFVQSEILGALEISLFVSVICGFPFVNSLSIVLIVYFKVVSVYWIYP